MLVLGSDRLRAILATSGALVWLAVDVWLDRVDVAGRTATVVVAVIACLVIVAGTLLGRVDGRTRRGPLLLMACVGAALAPLAAALESPTDTEAGLTPAAAATAGLLILAALGCALRAGPAVSRRRALAAGVVVVASGAVVAFMRMLQPGGRFGVVVLFGATLLTAVVVLSRPWPARSGVSSYAGLAGLTLLAYPLLMLVTLFVTVSWLPIAKVITGLAGNPPVNAADWDAVLAILGIAAGLAFGLPISWITRNRLLTEP
ncbi:hypothetical protein GCM10027605_53840 [Micromonospora zhanjiangensis]